MKFPDKANAETESRIVTVKDWKIGSLALTYNEYGFFFHNGNVLKLEGGEGYMT